MAAAGTTTLANETALNERALNDRDLITAAQHSDTGAFGMLVNRYRDGVVGVVYRMCGDPWLAEEAAQEAFVRAWLHLAGYDPRYSFRSWVYRIAINAALDALRREKPVVDVDEIDDIVGDIDAHVAGNGDPEMALVKKERASRVRRALLALPAPGRAVLVLREYGGLSYAEIAGALDIPLGTVMSRLNSARGQLRQSLAGLLEVL
jgi:RNA polymerase sigma-70 factor (ECF subfamily)